MKRVLACACLTLISALLLGLIGCGLPILEPALEPNPSPVELQAPTPRVSGAIARSADRQGVFESYGTPSAPPPAGRPAVVPASEPGDVTLTFVDSDVREIIRVILGATLKLNYTIDPSIQGTASLEIAKPLPRSQLLARLTSNITGRRRSRDESMR